MSLFEKRSKTINKVLLLPVEEIVPNPNQPRKYFDQDSLQELCRSIITSGLLQPVTVRKLPEGKYELISGERRYMAFCSLGKEYIPAIVEEYTAEQSAVLALIENLQRKDLNYFEEAAGIEKLMKEQGMTQQQVSRKLGKAQSTVANKLRLLRYPTSVQEKMLTNNLTERHARSLLKLPDTSMLDQVVDHIVENNLNVEQTESYVKAILEDKEAAAKRPRLFVVKDMRIFLNSINKAVEMMNASGIAVETRKNECEEYLEFTIKVPKNEVYKQKPVGQQA